MDVRPDKPTNKTTQLEQLMLEQQATINELTAKLAQSQTKISSLSTTTESQQSTIEILEQKIRFLQHQQFGQKSERNLNQYHLFEEAELAVLNEPESDAGAEDDATDVAAHKRAKKKTSPLPKALPRVDVLHDLTEEEKRCECGQTLQHIGDDVHEQLCVIPLQYYVLNHIKRQYACRCGSCMKSATMPTQPIPGSGASPQIIAHTMVYKYQNGVPLYRQEKMAEREKVPLPRAKLARWVIGGSNQLIPLINLLVDTFYSYDIAWSDDTRIQVLKEENKSAQSQSALWIRRGGPPDKPVILVDYASSKSGDTCYRLLSEFHGYLISDGASNFNHSVRENKLTPVLCNDHARRRFDRVIKTVGKDKARGSIALQALERYGKLYRLEREIKHLTPEQKKNERVEKAKPLWKAFIKWAEKKQQEGVSNAHTMDALNYLLSHQDGLQNYCLDGRLPISNILSEQVAKTIAIARKNFIFADTPAGAHASARVFSIIETAKANGHNPMHYLSYVLERLPNINSVEDVELVLPWNITPEQTHDYYHALPKP